MVQGTGSSVGKSLLVAGLCRLFVRRGVRVAPFKAQNMALNAAVTADGSEIGRAQALQARAARIEPTADMNPILLKPEGESRCQVVVRGRTRASLGWREYRARRSEWIDVLGESLVTLGAQHDLVLLEGAGSPAEINLKAGEIVNMTTARLARAPVLLAGDIDRGGVLAALVGTHELLDPEERAHLAGYLINKFRGDVALLRPGLEMLEKRTGVPVLGVVPYLDCLHLPDEDSLDLDCRRRAKPREGSPKVRIVRLPRISNFDDFLPLEAEPDVDCAYVRAPAELIGADLVILPGSKSTRSDLCWLREQGFETALRDHVAAGGALLGICGGCQMLGLRVEDPLGCESDPGGERGLGMLDLETHFEYPKITRRVRARSAAGGILGGGLARERVFEGYEIHSGRVRRLGADEPLFELEDGTLDGAQRGRVAGTLLHGLFEDDSLRAALLGELARRRGSRTFVSRPFPSAERSLDRLADALEAALDVARLERIVERGLPPGVSG
jgi:adenosylcobyric acid synthase